MSIVLDVIASTTTVTQTLLGPVQNLFFFRSALTLELFKYDLRKILVILTSHELYKIL